MSQTSKIRSKSIIFEPAGYLLVIGVASLVFILRNRAAMSLPNFYAEDATIFVNNILLHNPLSVFTTLFNGYLVVGQYFITYLAYLGNTLVGGDIATLPKAISVVSSLFLGLCASLPYILFKQQLGRVLALLLVLVSACVPMANSSYFIIGTIGNLKFAFFYVAFLLVLYRAINTNTKRNRAPYFVDGLILICVLTNATAFFLIPWLFAPYAKAAYKTRKLDIRGLSRLPDARSAMVLFVLAALYVVFVYLRGIPALPGYLDTPYKVHATIPILERVTIFSWLYPITTMLHDRITFAALTVVIVAWWHYRKPDRIIIVFCLYAIAVATALFVVNRTGVSDYFLGYAQNGGPDQFFYAQNWIFIFLSFWLAREWFKRQDVAGRVLVSLALGVFLLWSVPLGTSYDGAKRLYPSLGTSDRDVKQACAASSSKNVDMQIYPSSEWKWSIERSELCAN